MEKFLDSDALLYNLTNGVLTLDARDGHIIYANPACCEILELERKELIGNTIINCIEQN